MGSQEQDTPAHPGIPTGPRWSQAGLRVPTGPSAACPVEQRCCGTNQDGNRAQDRARWPRGTQGRKDTGLCSLPARGGSREQRCSTHTRVTLIPRERERDGWGVWGEQMQDQGSGETLEPTRKSIIARPGLVQTSFSFGPRLYFVCVSFLGLLPQHTEVPRLGVKSEP